MKHAVRMFLLVMLLAALPLRGYAGVFMALCEGHHGGAVPVQEHAHEHGDGHHHDSGDSPESVPHAASVCSVCASCCAGAGVAPETGRVFAFLLPVGDRIPFVDRHVSGVVLDHLERPPLAL